MKEIARIATRAAGSDPSGDDGLLLGLMLVDGKGILKPYTVYSLMEVDGVLLLKEAGPSCGHPEYGGVVGGWAFSWGGRTFEHIVVNEPFVYTRAEWLKMIGLENES